MNGGYKIIWKLSDGHEACIKQKCHCFEDFTEPLACFCVSKNIMVKGIKIYKLLLYVVRIPIQYSFVIKFSIFSFYFVITCTICNGFYTIK